MKTLISLTLLIIAFVSLSFTIANKTIQSTAPHIQFESVAHDYGDIALNGNGSYSFKFTNTGKEPLIIQNVQSSCGCTIASKPTAPILPGEGSEITVKYDTRRAGPFHKNITISTNADNPTIVLTIKGDVKPAKTEEAPVKSVNEGFTPVAH